VSAGSCSRRRRRLRCRLSGRARQAAASPPGRRRLRRVLRLIARRQPLLLLAGGLSLAMWAARMLVVLGQWVAERIG